MHKSAHTTIEVALAYFFMIRGLVVWVVWMGSVGKKINKINVLANSPHHPHTT